MGCVWSLVLISFVSDCVWSPVAMDCVEDCVWIHFCARLVVATHSVSTHSVSTHCAAPPVADSHSRGNPSPHSDSSAHCAPAGTTAIAVSVESRGTLDSATDAARSQNATDAAPAVLVKLPPAETPAVPAPVARETDFPREIDDAATNALPAGNCVCAGGKIPANRLCAPSRGFLPAGIPAVRPVGRWRERGAGGARRAVSRFPRGAVGF